MFLDKPVTEKPAETCMGSGKGNPSGGWRWSSPPGAVRVVYVSIGGVCEAIDRAIQKLPIKARLVTRTEGF